MLLQRVSIVDEVEFGFNLPMNMSSASRWGTARLSALNGRWELVIIPDTRFLRFLVRQAG